jgi:exodeoxyribonuclease V alpha subunit
VRDAVAHLNARQREAVEATLTAPVLALTGGPGTGKTTTVRAMVTLQRASGQTVLLAAPTGRAAKRLNEATKHPASTIHRLLEIDPRTGDFARGEGNPLACDALVVDEASMLDVELARDVVAALPAGARLVLVGDVDQLPSVGPGAVLADVIASGVVEVVRLSRIFRQASRSLIVENAHRIRDGELPDVGEAPKGADFYFFERAEPERVAETVEALVTERIPRGFGLDPIDDVQVLTPMHKGPLGAAALNAALQARLAPAGASVTRGARTFRVGDKVMQTRNDYDRDVWNGDLGRITTIDDAERRVVVRIDGRDVVYDEDDLDDLVLAYATTVHKSQGSEYPCVVVPVHTQHFVMLRRNLLYTAVTRGKRLVILVGTRRALEIAVRTGDDGARWSRLAERLRANVRP